MSSDISMVKSLILSLSVDELDLLGIVAQAVRLVQLMSFLLERDSIGSGRISGK